MQEIDQQPQQHKKQQGPKRRNHVIPLPRLNQRDIQIDILQKELTQLKSNIDP